MPIRDALGIPVAQPYITIIDKQGRIRRKADVGEWFGKEKGVEELKKRLDLVLNDVPVKTASQPK